MWDAIYCDNNDGNAPRILWKLVWKVKEFVVANEEEPWFT